MVRRAGIRSHMRSQDDTRRALHGIALMAELRQTRLLAIEAAHDLPFQSAEGAIKSLTAIDRAIEHQEFRSSEQHQRDRFHFALGLVGPFYPPRVPASHPERDTTPGGLVPPVPSEEVAPT